MGDAPSRTALSVAGMPAMRSLLALLLVVCLSSFAFAQTSFQPLQRPTESGGQYTWEMNLAYTPSGQEGFAVDEFGQPYSYTRFSQHWQFSISGTVSLSSDWKIGFSGANSTTERKETRKYFDHETDLKSTQHDFAYSMSSEYRIDPKNAWDPRISLSFGHPWQGSVGVSASLLRDPVVLVGRVKMLTQADEPHNWLSLALGTGFVANARTNLSTSANITIPTRGVGLPTSTIGIRVLYSLDSESKKQVGARITLSMQGEVPWCTVEAEASWRGP